MVSRAYGSSSDAQYFQAINLTNDRGIESLKDATMSLWKEDLRASRHWLELRSPVETMILLESEMQDTSGSIHVCWIRTPRIGQPASAPTRVNTMTKEYEKFAPGHVIARTARIYPATLEIDMAIDAFFTPRTDYAELGLQPSVINMVNHSLICVDPS
ncbi:uncharacterized protein F4807DRAFT_456763 [Annulohypoxylon truncatum]|uniref:uncharacterized protein n=1 Tax=Annulohypoxylon truncatum TaxID=327061 RepID=UPI0020076BA4|nr:uncharacterized protein F4807DRAFT_456763 [Annulohypoxylon truncatum]KAI1213419.1 hypothetical protein F4807DRAFT_456763 [Annulohypoxylon truncatum]